MVTDLQQMEVFQPDVANIINNYVNTNQRKFLCVELLNTLNDVRRTVDRAFTIDGMYYQPFPNEGCKYRRCQQCKWWHCVMDNDIATKITIQSCFHCSNVYKTV